MQLTFHGAAQTVTGSQHLLRINGKTVLLDCGLFQGRRAESQQRNRNFPFSANNLDAVILSHAHLDHCGNLPNLVKQGYEGPVFATPATAHLTDIMLRDAGHVQEADATFLNRRAAQRGGPKVEPLYTIEDAGRVSGQLAPHGYKQPFQPIPGVTATFFDAGHILGSAGVLLEFEGGGRSLRMVFSGDIGRRDLPILRDPELPPAVDLLLMECTYGDQPHDPPSAAYERLRSVVERTAARGGRVIVPAFAVGRTQALIYYLHQMIDRGELPRIPIYIDSPLAINVTDIHQQHPECFDEETLRILREDAHGAAFGFDDLTYTRSVEESKAINAMPGPLVVISASGMAETGRILHHLRNNIEDRRNTVLITSWMAPDTLGRRLAEGQSTVRIFGQEHKVRAEVASIEGLSAHAGQDFLLEYAKSQDGRSSRVFLVHGEAGPAQALREKLEQVGFTKVGFPARGDVVQI